jgi:hypothetical protein
MVEELAREFRFMNKGVALILFGSVGDLTLPGRR